MWTEVRFALASALLVASLFTFFTGVLGSFRFRDSLQKLHAAGVNDTLGVFLAVCAMILAEGWNFVSVKFILIAVFLWIASPVSTHLIAQFITRSCQRKEEKR